MSKPGPQLSKTQMFMQQALLIVTLFLGYQLFVNGNKSPADSRPVGEVMTAMRQLNSDVSDVSIVAQNRILDGKLSDQVKANKIDQTEADKVRLEGGLLVADTQLKGGILKNEISRLEASYNTLQGLKKEFGDKPVWKDNTIAVADVSADPKFGWRQWTGDGLYDKAVETLSAFNKADLVVGFIPGFQFIDFLVHLTGAIPSFSYAFAALLLAVAVRGVIFPVSQKQYKWSRQMQQLQPLVEDIKAKYKDEPQTLQVKTMELYKEYGINPIAGCVPAVIQLPLFITVYRCMLHYRFEFQKGVFLWINPNSGKFFAPNLGQIDNVLIVIYTITMVISTYLTPVSNPENAKQQRSIGLMMAVLFGGMMLFGAFPVPSAFVLYWTFTNLLVMVQSYYAYRLPLEPLTKKNVVASGGVFPMPGFTNNNGHTNGKSQHQAIEPSNGKTGKPVKHKPKKRK